MRLEDLVNFFETLTPQSLERLGDFYAPDARFKDPFNDVQGVAAIRRIFEHMYRQVDAPRFVVSDRLAEGDRAMLVWNFHFVRRGQPQVIRGATHLCFANDGKVLIHRDYWDAAEELYMTLPGIGWLMRRLRAALAAG
ncbi:nuclear transport factor 2 family protein [Propionivibrio sp.]|uniref:nuclear transport factor 2 family protein n=1 Tax=Propionivibrio sp. TaxID=2212460 RepID=UPI00272E22CE|nr:nuclear transport factor 2 family protein [Propionivibrio sp.]